MIFGLFTESSALTLILTFMVNSTLILGSVWLADRFALLARARLSDIVWRLAVVAALLAVMPMPDRIGSRIGLTVAPSHQSSVITTEPPLTSAIQSPTERIPVQDEWRTSEISNIEVEPEAAFYPVKVPQPENRPGAANQLVNDSFPGSYPDLNIMAGIAALPWLWIGLGLWFGIVAVLLVRLFGGYRAAMYGFGERAPLDHKTPTSQMLHSLCRSQRVRHAPKLTVSTVISSPVSLIGNEICVPRWAIDELDAEQMKVLLAHELAHQTRHDPEMLLVLQILERLFFFQPLFTVAKHRLRTLAEFFADERAAENTKDARVVASTLLTCADKIVKQQNRQWGFAMTSEPSALEVRVRQLLASGPGILGKVGLLGKVTAAALLLGAVVGLPRFEVEAQSEPEAPDVPALAPVAESARLPMLAAKPDVILAPTADSVALLPALAAVPDVMPVLAADGVAPLPALAALPVPSADSIAPLPALAPVSEAFASAVVVSTSAGASTVHSVNGGHSIISFEDDGLKIDAEYEGDITFSDNEDDVIALDRGGYLDIELEQDGEEYELRYERDGAGIARELRVNGDLGAYDPAIAKTILLAFFRATGAFSGDRVARFLDAGGAQAVMDEMDELITEFGLRTYTLHLVKQTDLSNSEQRRLVAQLSDLESDYEMRTAYIALLDNEDVSDDNMQRILTAAINIESDYEVRTLLVQVIEGRDLDGEVLQSMVTLANGIDSDYELRVITLAAFEHQEIERNIGTSLLDVARRNIESDYEMRVIIVSAAELLRSSREASQIAINMLDELGSDYEKRVSIGAIVDSGSLTANNWLDLIHAAAEVDSDYESAVSLAKIASVMPMEGNIISAFEGAVDTISSDYEIKRARSALNDRGF